MYRKLDADDAHASKAKTKRDYISDDSPLCKFNSWQLTRFSGVSARYAFTRIHSCGSVTECHFSMLQDSSMHITLHKVIGKLHGTHRQHDRIRSPVD